MASSHCEEDLSCPVCRDIYKDPVILSCSHSFCKACLQEFWRDREDADCPLCGEISSMSNPPFSFALKNLYESFRSQGAPAGPEVLCSLHREELKLFCLDDLQLICVVCQSSRKHKSHNCCPIEEALEDHKKELQAPLKTLRDKLQVFTEIKQTCDRGAEHLKVQALHTETQIKEEFKKLHQFLYEEEEVRVAALKEEEEQKSQTMKEKIEGLGRELSTLSNTIGVIEQELRAEDFFSFLQNYKTTLNRAQCNLPHPQLVSGALIDEAKHLGNLSFRVWEKMKERVKFTPVTLDPNTAAPWFSISDDLTSVRCTVTPQQLPDNPERNRYAIVLGSESFSSGEHSWEVEVGDHPDWVIGVAKESFDRKSDELKMTPQHGIWAIGYMSGKYFSLAKTRTVRRSLQRVRVQLDYNGGKLSFYDPEDRTRLCTYKHTFTEKLYPFFNIGEAGDAKHPDINICQSEVSFSVI